MVWSSPVATQASPTWPKPQTLIDSSPPNGCHIRHLLLLLVEKDQGNAPIDLGMDGREQQRQKVREETLQLGADVAARRLAVVRARPCNGLRAEASGSGQKKAAGGWWPPRTRRY